MTQEEKDLLLKDLSARLPYGVKIHINSPIEEQNSMELFDVNLDSEHIGVGNEKWVFRAIPIIDDEDEAKVIKPYLRPLSSMTEEERHELIHFGGIVRIDTGEVIDVSCLGFKHHANNQDWLNAHHFDYRGLIPMGLALEAPEGMYK